MFVIREETDAYAIVGQAEPGWAVGWVQIMAINFGV